jgi:PhnB protein
MQIHPYLNFNGCCEEAINFYLQAIGGEILMQSRFRDAPGTPMAAPGNEDKIMHATVRLGNTEIMASDGQCDGTSRMSGFSLSYTTDDISLAKQVFAKLGEGGIVTMPFAETFWSPGFGMVVDRFGVNWMVNVLQQMSN